MFCSIGTVQKAFVQPSDHLQMRAFSMLIKFCQFLIDFHKHFRVYLGNLGSSVRERDIERFFKMYGRLRGVVIKNGFGFVKFDDER